MSDIVWPTEFFELAARHAQRGSYAGLGKLDELGQAGLAVNIPKALDAYQNGAAHGDDAALAALSALSLRLAAEHETALKKIEALEQQSLREVAGQRFAQDPVVAAASNSLPISRWARIRGLIRGRLSAGRR